jgi:hypothetical protein
MLDHNAATIFAVESPREVRSIRKMLVSRQTELAELIAIGSAEDWPDYCKRVGLLQGIKEAIAMCDEMEKRER